MHCTAKRVRRYVTGIFFFSSFKHFCVFCAAKKIKRREGETAKMRRKGASAPKNILVGGGGEIPAGFTFRPPESDNPLDIWPQNI